MDLQRELARLALQRLQSSQSVRTRSSKESDNDGAEGSTTQSQNPYRTSSSHGGRGRRKLAPAASAPADDDDGQDASDAESDSSMCLERPPPGRDESPDGYEMRSRYWEAMDVLNRSMAASDPALNCVYDGVAPLCDAGRGVMLPPPLPAPPAPAPPTQTPNASSGGSGGRSYSPETRIISAELSGKAIKEDLEAVWKVIAEVMERRPRVIEEGTTAAAADQLLRVEGHSDRGRNPAARARMVEDAALLVVRAADEWGHIVKERGPVSSNADDKDVPKLVERSKRIKEAAAKVARAAGGLAERMEAGCVGPKSCG
ncbi:hypothetical protein GGTG_05649 [Gaeumannomyces tritici R3-111a-1]|uniref:Uncharacterized protein n=1 Tax=Gaeumannomyces tritici (strain R3-111a-1) TaxID=644352 RepID=J3NWI6_GAET3|nr:hypothetical protein GGTG_05649 [Gaeumannomyces tritici R3-111a-1]EJT75718.1 hypothetical protein GGTG_05649 [Gaeumannomyces tritici R3-111a-1]